MSKPTPHEAALVKAKVLLMTMPGTVFMASLLMSLKTVWDTTQPTAWTDGLRLGINPAFFMTLPPAQQLFVLVHETMHVALMHMGRLMGRQHDKWNIACDHFINLFLKEKGYQMPTWVYVDPKFAGMSADEIYKALPDEPIDPRASDMRKAGDMSEEEVTQKITDALVRAHVQAKQSNEKPGSIPGEVELFLENLLAPKMPWYQILRRYMKEMGKQDYSFRRPNRRHFPQHYLPSLQGGTLMDIASAVDISGSVSDHDFSIIVGEVEQIFKACRPKAMHIVQFDTEIKSVDKVSSISALRNIHFTGRGGTWIKPVTDWANKHKPNLLLVFTDGGFSFPEDEQPTCPVIWVIHNNPGWTAPYGQVVHYEIE